MNFRSMTLTKKVDFSNNAEILVLKIISDIYIVETEGLTKLFNKLFQRDKIHEEDHYIEIALCGPEGLFQ